MNSVGVLQVAGSLSLLNWTLLVYSPRTLFGEGPILVAIRDPNVFGVKSGEDSTKKIH